MEARKNSRKIAVQAVFQFFFSNDEISKILEEFCRYRIKEKQNCEKKYDIIFLKEIVEGVFKNKKEITKLIEEHSFKDWPIQRLDPTMHAIISLAIYEFSFCKKTPFKVIINEYVSIARMYLDNNNTGFVNGILDSLAKKIRNNNE